MTPDARLLVRCDVLPVVPEGARVWHADPKWISEHGIYLTPRNDGSVGVLWCGASSHTTAWPSNLLLDLSAPETRDGVPVRLDALPWALRVLQLCAHPDAENDGPLRVTIIDVIGGRLTIASLNMSHSIHVAMPDLTGLSPDDADRAVVAAALGGAS